MGLFILIAISIALSLVLHFTSKLFRVRNPSYKKALGITTVSTLLIFYIGGYVYEQFPRDAEYLGTLVVAILASIVFYVFLKAFYSIEPENPLSALSRVSIYLFGLMLSGSILFLLHPVIAGGPCSCPANSRIPGSIIATLFRNNSTRNLQYDCSQFGCSFSYAVIPLDLILPAASFFVLGVISRKRFGV